MGEMVSRGKGGLTEMRMVEYDGQERVEGGCASVLVLKQVLRDDT